MPLGPDSPDADLAPLSPWQSLAAHRASGVRLAFGVCWLVYALARLTLLEAQQPSWWAFDALLLAGAVLLIARPGRLAWATICVALAGPLAFLGDWLTQSVALLVVALTGLAFGERRGEQQTAAMAAHHRVAIAIYALAAFHKLNTGFLDPTLSCGVHGWSRLVEELPPLAAIPMPGAAVAPLTLFAELGLAALVALAPGAALVAWAVFHAPLTIALAPAFAFAVLPGIVAALDPAVVAPPRRRATIGAAGAVAASVYLALAAHPSPILAFKLALMCGVATFAVVAGVIHKRSIRFDKFPRRAAAFALALFVLNGLTPYAGTQFQHTGAMLSNLRIDDGCFNHLLVPESLPRLDPYVRIERASMGNAESGTIGIFGESETKLLTILWSPSALVRLQRNWCTARTRPIALDFSYRGERWSVSDLCDPDTVLPVENGIFGGRALFSGWLRFQKNLPRECPAACVH
jgi:multisubunit Na+/H+ antiporter MnhB subunit